MHLQEVGQLMTATFPARRSYVVASNSAPKYLADIFEAWPFLKDADQVDIDFFAIKNFQNNCLRSKISKSAKNPAKVLDK